MQPLKRKDSCTFKREKPLEVQERIYLLGRLPTAHTIPGVSSPTRKLFSRLLATPATSLTVSGCAVARPELRIASADSSINTRRQVRTHIPQQRFVNPKAIGHLSGYPTILPSMKASAPFGD
jgi:hypothetical protein